MAKPKREQSDAVRTVDLTPYIGGHIEAKNERLLAILEKLSAQSDKKVIVTSYPACNSEE